MYPTTRQHRTGWRHARSLAPCTFIRIMVEWRGGRVIRTAARWAQHTLAIASAVLAAAASCSNNLAAASALSCKAGGGGHKSERALVCGGLGRRKHVTHSCAATAPHPSTPFPPGPSWPPLPQGPAAARQPAGSGPAPPSHASPAHSPPDASAAPHLPVHVTAITPHMVPGSHTPSWQRGRGATWGAHNQWKPTKGGRDGGRGLRCP